jgi:hypothetical protein
MMDYPNIDQLREAVDEFCYGKMDSNTELAIFHYAGRGTFSMAGEGSTAGKHIMMSSCWKDYSKAQGGFARVSVYRVTYVLRPSSDVHALLQAAGSWGGHWVDFSVPPPTP